MQPFDDGDFDQRYAEVISPAIKAAGLETYRVDQDPKVSIPIQEIETGFVRRKFVWLRPPWTIPTSGLISASRSRARK
jgi:hypothetical protein